MPLISGKKQKNIAFSEIVIFFRNFPNRFVTVTTFAMKNNEWHNLSVLQLRQLLHQLLHYLNGEQQVTTTTIEKQLELKSLSKMRNADTYTGKSFNQINTLNAINAIIAHHQIKVQLSLINGINVFQFTSNVPPKNPTPSTFVYLYHYYSSIHQQVMQAKWVASSDFKQAQMFFYNHEKQIVHKLPSAKITQIGHNLFAQTNGNQPSLLILHTANYQPQQLGFLAGTYNSIRQRDSSPISGRVVLQKMESEEVFLQNICHATPPPIEQYLHQQQCLGANKVFFSLNEFTR